MFPHHCFVGGNINTIDLVLGDKALDPLNLWSHVFQNTARFLGNCLYLVSSETSSVWNFPFDNIFWHLFSPVDAVPSPKLGSAPRILIRAMVNSYRIDFLTFVAVPHKV